MEKNLNAARVQCKVCLDELISYGGRFVSCSCMQMTESGGRGVAIDHTMYYTRYIGYPHEMNHLPDIKRKDVKSFVIHHTELLPGVNDD